MKPVAWMLTLPDGTHDWILDGQGCDGYIPLYTAPRELSDEEILEVSHTVPYANRFEFARAILKKASEK